MIRIYDEVLIDPAEYRSMALTLDFADVTLGPDTFKGIAQPPDDRLIKSIAKLEPDLHPQITFLRKSPAGQREPNYIHSDSMMGKTTGIFYLNPAPVEGDGTAFWETDGNMRGDWSPDLLSRKWNEWTTVEAKFNRLVLFDADLFHSRCLIDNYGYGDEARLIQVVFCQ